MESYFEVSFPGDMEVEWTSFGAEASPVVEESNGRKTFIWKRKDLEKITKEPAMPPISRISDRVLVTSIESWEYYASEFWDLAQGRAKPNKAIKKKAKELTKGLKTKEEKIEALYNYVATKIRYVAIELGRGKYQPHKASETFTNKYGDCKDKATLLISMLRVAGIKAHPVLILSGLNAKTDFQAPPPGKGMNHAIVAVERESGLQLLDPTCDTCPYEYLPDNDRGKKALAIVPRNGEVKKVVGPVPFKPAESEVKVDQKVELNKEGDLNTSVEISHTGYYSYSLKSWMESYSNDRQKQMYRGLLSQLESGAVLQNFSHSDLEDVNKRLKLDISYQKKGYADQLGDSLLFQTPPSLRLPLSRNYDQYVSLPAEERKYPLQMVPSTVVDKSTITFPEEKEVVKPDGVEIDTRWASYSSSYEISESGKLNVTRKFVKKKPLLPVEGYPEFKELVNKMRKDQQSNFQLKS
uniref:Protein containing Transglutaminase-like domain protein n=1 Tax=uncultured organism TaxID=155900 RepID=M1QBX7_9ZZZZ|nr:protein containing Transglutaminase-like domain protein [uncultured organism]